jgi:hypothetical protein
MKCTDCSFWTLSWETMKNHYAIVHPDVKRPDSYFTKEARAK